jgi:hypothetical protein
MLLLAAAALAASTVPDGPVRPPGATVRATASVRILSSATIRFDEPGAGLPRIRLSQLRGPAGELQPIRLIEFE